MITFKPRAKPSDAYPLDLDASERFTRFGMASATHPYPPIIGSISGILPLFDSFVMAGAIGKTAFGPGSTTVPVNLQYQITVPGLTKMG